MYKKVVENYVPINEQEASDKIMMLEYGAYVYARYVDKYLDNTALKNLMTAMYHYCNAATEYANIY